MTECDYCIHVEMCGWRKELEERGCDFFDDGNKWISVSERLPEEGQRVFVTQMVGERTVVYCTSFPFDKMKEKYIIAWMPLPKPYKAERSDKGCR